MPLFTSSQVALVTGAASGIGRSVVEELVKEGCQNIIAADISESGLQETAARAKNIAEKYHMVAKIHCTKVDITKDGEVQDMVDSGVKEFGRIDISVHCAGIAGTFGETHELSIEDFDKVANINYRGVWVTERAVLKQMRNQEPRELGNKTKSRGNIVNITSILGHVGMPIISPYIAAKHGVEGLTKADAIDYAKHNIRVNAVAAGFTGPTNLLDSGAWRVLEPIIQSCPMERLGDVGEIAAAVTFLASDKASFITGTSLAVDGGYTCH